MSSSPHDEIVTFASFFLSFFFFPGLFRSEMVKVSGFFKGHASFIIQPISIAFRNSIKLYHAYTYSSLFSGFQFVCLFAGCCFVVLPNTSDFK